MSKQLNQDQKSNNCTLQTAALLNGMRLSLIIRRYNI